METIVKNITVHNKGCIGCQKFNADVMIVMLADGNFNDFFLSTEQATQLVENIQKVLKQNEEV